MGFFIRINPSVVRFAKLERALLLNFIKPMTYDEAIDYLFKAAPLFQNVGAGAYKEGLENSLLLDDYHGHPHQKYKVIHVAGTNGKGSVCHTLAAILQHAGYKVGLYTSPHLLTFRERIRVNGQMISPDRVVRFVEEERGFFEPLHPSFFELTTALAFAYFAEQEVDVAIVEVGLGGRLDCTNIVTPIMSIITNISRDHTQFLGNTLPEIAAEKAGIIKPGVPVVVGEADDEVRAVFVRKAAEEGAPIHFATDMKLLNWGARIPDGEGLEYNTVEYSQFQGELSGIYQFENTRTVLTALHFLPLKFTEGDVHYGFAHVSELTGLQGRWQRLSKDPDVVCDTGHNEGGWQWLGMALDSVLNRYTRLFVVFGMAADKDVDKVLAKLPVRATYFFVQASVKRAMPVGELQRRAADIGLSGTCFDSVAEARKAVLREAGAGDFVFVGGSTFVVADWLGAAMAEE